MILDKIKDRIGSLPGKIGISYMDLATGEGCFAGNCDVFISSGMVKLPLLVEVYRQLEAGLLQKESVYKLRGEDQIPPQNNHGIVPTYGVLNCLHVGLELTLEDLVRLVTCVSDNAAFNILAGLAGLDNVERTMRNLGFSNIRVRRKLFDQEKIDQGEDNYHSVTEVAELFHRIYKGQLISQKASQEMLHMMVCHQRTNVIPYYFDEDMPIAHQTGYDCGIIHDMGVVLSEAPFILCMSANEVDTRKAESVMRDVALLCFKYSLELKEQSMASRDVRKSD